jgi:phosphate-selective porin OprO and OprP
MRRSATALLVVTMIGSNAYALDDSQARIIELEQRMKAMTDSMTQQIDHLSDQVQRLQSQLEQAGVRQSTDEKKSNDLVKASIRETGGLKEGLVLEDGSELWKLQLNGSLYGDYRHFTPDVQNTDTFSVRHARISTTLFLLKDFSFRLEGEYANDNTGAKGTTALTNGYFDFSRWSQAKLRVGQFRPLFGLEHTSLDNFLGFQERSLMENLIQDLAYDRGVMVHGAPVNGTYYSVALTNGTGQNIDNISSTSNPKSDSFDTTVRFRANLAEIMGVKDTVLHLGASYNQGTMSMVSKTVANSAITEARGLKFFDPEAFTGSDVDRNRWGIEAALARGPVKLQGEYMRSSYKGTSAGGIDYDRSMQGWYGEASWIVTGESYADTYSSGLFNRIRPKHNLDYTNGWGAFELGLRYSSFDASDFSILAAGSVNPGTGVIIPTATVRGANEADAWTLSANWIFNPFVRVMVNYIRTNFYSPVLVTGISSNHENALTMRAQFDF